MSVLAAVASVALSVAAGSSGTTSNTQEIGNGGIIELDVFGLSGGPTSNTRFNTLFFFGNNGVSGFPVLAIPAVHVGWEFDQNAILIGAQLFFVGGGASGQSGPQEISIPITFRRYLKPLVPYSFSPFIEGTYAADFLSTGRDVSLQFGFSIDLGVGGEYLFTPNFGLMGKALLGFQHIPSQFLNTGSDTNAVGIGGVLGVLVHIY
jgi:hypothetical protein